MNIESGLRKALTTNSSTFGIINPYSSQRKLFEVAAVLEVADSGVISDDTCGQVRKLIFETINLTPALVTSEDAKAIAMVCECFLSEQELIEVVSKKTVLLEAVVKYPKFFSSDILKSLAAIYS